VFRQLNEDPSFLGIGDFTLNADVHLDRLLPASWGLDLPLSITHTSSAQDPSFLAQSDVVANRLEGLRETGSGSTRVGVRLRKLTPSANPLLGLLLDGTTLRAGYSSAGNSAITSRNESGGLDADLSYRRDLGSRTIALPGFLQSLLRALAPAGLESSAAFQRLLDSRFRWTPDLLSFGSGYVTQQNRAWRYNGILDLPGDSVPRPLESPRRVLRNDATLSFQPFRALDATLAASATGTCWAGAGQPGPVVRSALERARGRFAGMDVGWKLTGRCGRVSLPPDITTGCGSVLLRWSLRHRPQRAYLGSRRSGGDTLVELQRRFGNGSARPVTHACRPVQAWFGAADSAPGGRQGAPAAGRTGAAGPELDQHARLGLRARGSAAGCATSSAGVTCRASLQAVHRGEAQRARFRAGTGLALSRRLARAHLPHQQHQQH
jgi:hypothetical protein